jgi:hypothetical protein
MDAKNTEDTLRSYKAEFRAEAETIAAALPCDDKGLIRERLYKMIQYAIDRHDWYENQRHRFLALSLGLLAIVATLSPVLASLAAAIPTPVPAAAVASLVWISITAFLMIVIYSRLIGPPYPYRGLADIRSWIFRYSFSAGASAPRLSKRESVAENQVKEVLDAFKNFKRRWLEIAQKPTNFLAEDLEQVFILHLLQKHRADNLNKMTKILIVGVYGFFVLILSCVLIYMISPWNTIRPMLVWILCDD